jgi:hypothetical protein
MLYFMNYANPAIDFEEFEPFIPYSGYLDENGSKNGLGAGYGYLGSGYRDGYGSGYVPGYGCVGEDGNGYGHGNTWGMGSGWGHVW